MALMDQEMVRVGARSVVLPTMFVGVLAGGIWYAATQHAAVTALSVEVSSLKRQVERRTETEMAIDRRLARVEILLETIAGRLPPEQRAGGPR